MKTLPLKLDSEYQLDAYRDGKFEFSFSFTKTIPEDEQVRLANEYVEAINNREQLSALQQEKPIEICISYDAIKKSHEDSKLRIKELQQENEKLRKYRSVCGWVSVRNEEDLPPRHIEDNTGDITYVTKIMHDDGRGGSHITYMTRDEIQEASQSEDGRVDWLDENILKP